ncbi:MAG: tRNA uracil 4-sulfurtransferase ThiI [Gammaproteobacteria bacterium]
MSPAVLMLYLIKLFPEITIKGRPVRLRLVRQLRRNIRSVLSHLHDGIEVRGEWDALEVSCDDSDAELPGQVLNRLQCISGIHSILAVQRYPLPDMDGMLQITLTHFAERLQNKTFAVRCKRTGRHAFRSVDVEKYVGGGLNQHTDAAGVKLVNPDVLVPLEIRQDDFYVIHNRYRGLGGFPLGCQDSVLSLISGGFDSSVSSFHCMRRGLQTHYCFFNLGGKAHELAVKEVALYLWMKYHSSHRVRFVTVPFDTVVNEILSRVHHSQMGVILKRMMLRAADRIAHELNINTLVTGESVAQVSSQTLANLAVIDSVSNALVLRPLATMDKQDIIDTARSIGTEEFSRNIPEYCAVISDKPTTRARPERIAREEQGFDFTILEQAVGNARYQLITEVVDDFGEAAVEVAVVAEADANSTIIDIRHPQEQQARPFPAGRAEAAADLIAIPFYSLRSDFEKLDRNKQYLLYCDRGMMSRLHAAHLLDEGFRNVAVLSLEK